MKTGYLSRLTITLFLVFATVLSACSSNNQSTKEEGTIVPKQWKYPTNIPVPLKGTSETSEVILGSLSLNQVQITIPGGAFDSPTQVTVVNPASVPDVPGNYTPLGSPIDITSSANTRLNKPAVITFKVPDKEKYESDFKIGTFLIAYYNGQEWDFFPPDTTDYATGTVTFATYHFSLLALTGKVPVEELVKRYAHSATFGKLAQKKTEKLLENMVANVVDMILIDNLGWKDESTKYKIISSLANDDEYKNLYDQLSSGDIEKFNATLQVFAGKQIVKHVDKAAFIGALKGVIKNANVIAAASEAAGYMTEGQYAEAGRILGEKIADSFLVTKLVKATAEVVQYNIDLWKNAEIEKAYQAYKKGANGIFWGYNVDPGKFDDLWYQMRGVATRLEVEAVESEIKRRAALGLPNATDADLDKIRAQVKTDLEEVFKLRVTREIELEKEAARMKDLFIIFDESRLFDTGMYGFDADLMTVEYRFDRLYKMVAKILKDTRRGDWNTSAFSNDREICANDMVSLIKAWYSSNGQKEYADLIKKKFGIDINAATTATASPTKTTSTTASTRPVITGFDGPSSFEFDASFNVVGLYTFKVTVQGGTPPYYYIWKGSRAPQVMVEGPQYDKIQISPQEMRSPGSMADGYFVWVSVKDSKNQFATWGLGNTEFTYGLKFTGKFEVIDGVTTLVENSWGKVTEP